MIKRLEQANVLMREYLLIRQGLSINHLILALAGKAEIPLLLLCGKGGRTEFGSSDLNKTHIALSVSKFDNRIVGQKQSQPMGLQP